MKRAPVSVLLTGGRGFIGRHLIARLRSEGCETTEWEEDVRTIARCDRTADVVVHLAAAARHDQFTAEPCEAFDVNVTGTMAVLHHCRKAGARCVLASTSAVYSPSTDLRPLREDAATQPELPYSMSKWLAENLCRQQASDMGVASVALRLFNVYGPGQHFSFLVPYVVDCLTGKRRISLRMPEALRAFVYVDDVVEAILGACSFTEDGFHVINVGSGRGTRLLDMVGLAEEVYGRAAGVDETDPHVGEPSVVVADVSKAHDVLGWSPRITSNLG